MPSKTKEINKKNNKKEVIKKLPTTSAKKNIADKTKAKKVSTKKANSKIKQTSIKSKKISKQVKKVKKPIEIVESYDLPYRYNETIVKILYQTPDTLFVYWDIADSDRENYIKQYGENFFNITRPVLIIHNDTMNYSFEVPINDFANSWYLHVNDANCEYTVELGRRPKYYNSEKHVNIQNDYLYVTSSNVIEAPNDHVLFDRNVKNVYFKDVKTNIVTAKDITSISFLRNIGRIYNLYDLQSDFNKNSWIDSNHWQLDLNNPSSSSSTFK